MFPELILGRHPLVIVGGSVTWFIIRIPIRGQKEGKTCGKLVDNFYSCMGQKRSKLINPKFLIDTGGDPFNDFTQCEIRHKRQ